MKYRGEKIISYLLVLIGAAVYISLVFNNNVWLDEAFTATLVRTDMAEVLVRSMNDTLPPLYNIILKITTDIFGYTVPVMKLTSVLPMIITMLISATTVRKRHGFLVSSVFTVCLFTMPNLLFFGVEIRMYSLGFLFATASAVYGYECICGEKHACRDAEISRTDRRAEKKNWIIFTVMSVLAGYSHHFAFVAVGFVYLIILLYYLIFDRKNIKSFFICLAATFVLYLPCLIVTLKQLKSVSGYFSMPDVTLPVFVKYAIYPYIVGNKIVSVLLFASVMALAVMAVVKICKSGAVAGHVDYVSVNDEDVKKEEVDIAGAVKFDLDLLYALCLFFAYYGVLIFGTVISKIMTANIFVDRYLLFAHGFIWLFFAIALKKCPKKFVYAALAVVVLAGIVGYVKEFKIEYSTSPDELIAFLSENVEEGDVLYTIEDNEELAYCLPFYENKLIYYEDINKAAETADKDNGSVWIAVMDSEGSDLEELSGLDVSSHEINYIGEFLFDRYNFSLYKALKN